MNYKTVFVFSMILSIFLFSGCEYVIPKLDPANVRSEVASLLSGCSLNNAEYISAAIGDGATYVYGDKTISFPTKAEWKDHLDTIIPHTLSFSNVQFDQRQVEDATILTGDYEGFTMAKVSFTVQYYDGNGNPILPEENWEEEIIIHVKKSDYFGQSYTDITKIQPTYEDFLGLFIEEEN